MTTVARQVTAADMPISTLSSQHHIQHHSQQQQHQHHQHQQQTNQATAFIMMQDRNGFSPSPPPPREAVELNHRREKGPAKTKTVSFSDSQQPPPASKAPTSRSGRPPHKEEVVLAARDKTRQASPMIDELAKTARDDERLSSSCEVPSVGGAAFPGDEEGGGYIRQRSKTEIFSTLSGRGGGRNGGERRPVAPPHATDTQRGSNVPRFNPYTGTMGGGGAHGGSGLTSSSRNRANLLNSSKFSLSQPQLNNLDQQYHHHHHHQHQHSIQELVRPKDRIKMNMLSDGQEEGEGPEDGGLGEDYGSGYTPTLMKISHGDIQKHAVAVTTPIVPPIPPPKRMTVATTSLNRAGSDPNIIDGGGPVTPPTPTIPPATPDVGEPGAAKRERHSSVSGVGGKNGTLTSDIARAYREHLMEKMEREKNTKSVSPSPSAGSSEGGVALGTGHAHQSYHHQYPQGQGEITASTTLARKIQNMSPTQLQALDVVPDRAFYPRILPPSSSTASARMNSDHAQLPVTAESGDVHRINPFLSFQATNVSGYDMPDGGGGMEFSYATLPRNTRLAHSRPQLGVGNVTNLQSRAQSVSKLYMPPVPPHNHQQQYQQQAGQQGYLPGSHGGHAQLHNAAALSSLASNHSPSPPLSLPPSHVHTPQSVESAGERGWGSGIDTEPKLDWSSAATATGTTIATLAHQHGSHTPKSPVSIIPMAGKEREREREGEHLFRVGMTKKGVKPPVLPKPALPCRNGSTLTSAYPHAHERSTSDPAPSSTHATPIPKPRPQQQHRLGGTGMQQQAFKRPAVEMREMQVREDRTPSKSGGIKLHDYASLNSAHLPRRVRVSQGFCSGSTDVTMSQGEEFDLHFMRQTKAILLTDSSQIHYTVPLNSTGARFSVLYDPFGVERVALMGFQFKTAGVLMDLRNPPCVVAATRKVDGGRAESSVEPGEILVLEGTRNVFHGRLLKVFSVRDKAVKYLEESCPGCFTTSPDALEMSLAQVYESSVPLPQKALLHRTSAMSGDTIPVSLCSDAVTLKQFLLTRSVIATAITALSEKVPVSRLPALSISLELEVEVTEVSVSVRQAEKMRERTRVLLENGLTDISLTPYLDMPSTDSYMAQCALLLNSDPTTPAYEPEILIPDFFSPQLTRSVSPSPSPRNLQKQPPSQRTQPSLNQRRTTESRLESLERNYEVLEARVSSVCENLRQVACKMDQVHTYLSKAQSAMMRHKKHHLEQMQEGEETRRVSRMSSSGSSSSHQHPSFQSEEEGRGERKGSRMTSSTSSSSHHHHQSLSLPGDTAPPLAKPRRGDASSSTGVISSRLHGLKLSSGSAETDTSNDSKSPNDDVFLMTRSLSSSSNTTTNTTNATNTTDTANTANTKPPVLPKPKLLTGLQGKRVEVKKTHTKALRSASDEGTRSRTTVSVASVRAASPSVTSTDGVDPSPRLRKASSRESIDLKDYLLDPAPKSKATPIGRRSGVEGGSVGGSAGGRKEGEELEAEFEGIEAMTDDLANWCLQVEDELTQLYNDSLLSAV